MKGNTSCKACGAASTIKRRHRLRKPSPQRPMVYLAGGVWLRSGHESTYDAWPVLSPLTEYQKTLVCR